MATFSKLKNTIRESFNPYIHPTIKEGIYRHNLVALRIITLLSAIFDSLVLIVWIITSNPLVQEKAVLDNMVYAIITCGITFLISDFALRKSNKPYSFYRFMTIAYYLMILSFGMFTSYYHYAHGSQMIVFFTITFCLVNFVLLPPYISTVLVLGSYLVFYLILFAYDGASRIHLINYVMLAFITLIGSIHKYHMQGAELERIHRIETMNEMLQNVPIHDNITDLKNRYALRDDFNSYHNHHIIVIMLDINDFDKINEEYGTEAGDQILSNIGSLIKKHLTDSHSYRYGSDSFLIILQDLEVDIAMQRLSGWEKAMAVLSIPDTDKPVHCISGYSHGTPRDEEDLRLLIEAADRKRKDFS